MIGQQVGNYKVISLLGAGGMGEVYLAEHVTIGTRVAIKVLQAQISKDAEQVNRFFNEAKAVSKVRHSGPVKIFDCGFHEGSGQRVAYLAMEFLEGESLAARIKRLGTLPGEQVADIGRQIAGVLDAVHTAGITHRDLKPDNIFLVPDHELPSGERVKVLDFGIAKLTGTMAGPQTKGTMGTPAYMAPEQWNNAASVDGRADLYSLGCVMFEMAVGKPPFPAQSIGEACNHHLNSKPPRASEILQAIPMEFDTLVDRMLAKTVDQRPSLKEITLAFDTLRSSGATQRWQAAAVAGVAATLAPGSSPSLGIGSQPTIGSQPGGSQPGAHAGSHPGHVGSQPGHVPGMMNPLVTPSAPFAAHPGPSAAYPVAPGPSAAYPAQPGPSAAYPAQPTPHQAPHTPQHHTPQHHTPQHHTPQHHTPQHHAPPQPGNKGGKGLLIGLGAVVVIGGGVAAAVVATGGGSDAPKSAAASTDEPVKPAPPTTTTAPGGGSDQTLAGPADGSAAGSAATEALIPKPSKRELLLASNAFVDVHGVRVLSKQITAADYELVIGALPDGVARPASATAPIAMLTQPEAAAFCAAIDARLPTSDEWSQAAKGAWGIAVGATAGPLQEWTSTIQDELAVVRGGHETMGQAQLDKAARSRPPYFLQKEVAGATFDRKIASASTIGFRCADGPAPAVSQAEPPKVPARPPPTTPTRPPAPIVEKDLGNPLAGLGPTATQLLADAETAAKSSQWARALRLAEQAIAARPTSATKARAAMIAVLAACNLRNQSKASAYYALATPSSRTLVRQRCLSNGIEVGGASNTRPTPPPTTTTGTLDRAVIQRVVKRNMPRIRMCYEQALAKDPALQGRVTVKFTIGTTGNVVSAEASGLDASVASCVAAVVRRMSFPAPEGGTVTISYPFVFQPS